MKKTCGCCGKKYHPKYHLALILCELMNWKKEDAWNIQNYSLPQAKLKQLIRRVKRGKK